MGNVYSFLSDDKPSLNIRVLSYNEAVHALTEAEAVDNYLGRCEADEKNRISRSRCNYVPYRLTDSDRTMYTQQIADSVRNLPRHLLHIEGVKVVILVASADGGMPHTRPGNIICLPYSSLGVSRTTMIHELWHLHQRIFQKEWENFYENMWGWKKYSGMVPDMLQKNVRYNPDTIMSGLWCYNEEWVPLPIFENITQPDIRQSTIWFYHVKSGHRTREVPDELREMFGESVRGVVLEHPNEASAYMLSDADNSVGNAHAFSILRKGLGKYAF